MTQLETKVINESSSEVTLQLNNAGAYLDIEKLKKGQYYLIKTEPNATYREYWVGVVKDSPITFTSDDCIGSKEIKINEGNVVKMIPRGDEHTSSASSQSLGAKILGLLGFKSGS
ncbi:hypothetical protein KC19_12G180200 [Ceratodon purpureus]|uniref:DUF7748 domain-containing protein n=1 Tax=Ceratodon purpureus TaxID=3225 RepID=A0A8T0GAU1_CERPU|nr:hypothetical protein KC19_12G180200 [Ceratodon purpureus]